MPKAPRLVVVHRFLSDLKRGQNCRVHTPRQIRQIARSIKEFGYNVPILIDTEGTIIAGYGRYEACREMGWTEVPTICIDHLNDDQKLAFMIADNRLTENSEWDDKMLAEQLRELSVHDIDFDLEVTGFEIAEIDLRIEKLRRETGRRNGPRGQHSCTDCRIPPVKPEIYGSSIAIEFSAGICRSPHLF